MPDLARDRATAPGKPEEPASNGSAFTGAHIENADRITGRKSIVICGVTRGGTSFGASVFVRLGIPVTRPGEPELHRTYEHRQLRAAFQARDFEQVRRIAAEFGELYPVWAWKLPSVHSELELVGQCVPNPHFVMLFKEPLSVAARKNALKGKETIRKTKDVIGVFQRLATLAGQTRHPCMLVSYDRAMADLPSFLPEAAAYAGVTRFDPAAVTAAIRADQQHYLRGWQKNRARRVELRGAGPATSV